MVQFRAASLISFALLAISLTGVASAPTQRRQIGTCNGACDAGDDALEQAQEAAVESEIQAEATQVGTPPPPIPTSDPTDTSPGPSVTVTATVGDPLCQPGVIGFGNDETSTLCPTATAAAVRRAPAPIITAAPVARALRV